jgi:hypothetical protein
MGMERFDLGTVLGMTAFVLSMAFLFSVTLSLSP